MSRFGSCLRMVWLAGTSGILFASAQASAQTSVAPAAQADPAQADPAQAVATGDRQGGGLEEIVVTARRVEENLQKVPVSVGTLTSAALTNRQINSVADLKGSIAGLTTSRTSTAGGSYITIRGVTALAIPQPSADSGAGYYIDGVYIARGQGAGAGLADVSRVEVLRGPQGTLFGRNSANGSINFVTGTPVDEFKAQGSVLYGNYDQLRVNAMVNIPLTDTLITRFAYFHEEIDGDVKNTTTSPGRTVTGFGDLRPAREYGRGNTDSYLAKVRFTGIAGLTADYKFDYQDVHQSPGADQLLGYTSGTAGILAGLLPAQAPGAVTPSFSRLGQVNHDFSGTASIRNFGHLLQLEYAIDDALTTRSITAYRNTKSGGFTDLDGGDWRVPLPPAFTSSAPFCIACSANQLKQHSFSQENQLLGKWDKFNFTAGTFFFRERARFANTYALFTVAPEVPGVYTPNPNATTATGGLGDFVLGNNGIFINKSYAGYGHAEYKFSDMFDIAVGGRYTIDKRFTNDLRQFGSGANSVTYKRFTYDAALNYRIDDDKLLYVKYATGYVSGGIDSAVRFRPETDKQAEVGFKTEFLDRRLRLNGAAYYTWIKDRQATLPNTSATACNPVLLAAGFTTPCPVGLFVYNLPGTSKIKGFELEVTAAPVEGLTLTANLGYNDPNLSTGELQRAPKTNLAFSGEYDFPKFDNGSFVTFRVDGDYRSVYYGTGANLQSVFTGDIPAVLRPGFTTSEAYQQALFNASKGGDYWLVNARVSLADIPIGGGMARLSAFGRNLNNSKGLLFSVNYGSTINGTFERPRTYGVELGINF